MPVLTQLDQTQERGISCQYISTSALSKDDHDIQAVAESASTIASALLAVNIAHMLTYSIGAVRHVLLLRVIWGLSKETESRTTLNPRHNVGTCQSHLLRFHNSEL